MQSVPDKFFDPDLVLPQDEILPDVAQDNVTISSERWCILFYFKSAIFNKLNFFIMQRTMANNEYYDSNKDNDKTE